MLGRFFFLCSLWMAAGPAAAVTIYKYVDANGVVTYTDKAVAGAQVFVFRDRMVEHLEQQVKLQTLKHDGFETLQVRNDLYAPVEVELSVNAAQNAVGVPERPIRWVLAPRSAIRLATLSPRDASRPMQYKPKLRYALGDPRLQIASLDHTIWFHRPFRMDEWLLFVMESPNASGGRGLCLAYVYNRSGELVATMAQEGLIRLRDKPPTARS